MAVLFNVIASGVLTLIARYVPALGILSGLYSLAVLIPGLAISVRRLRDVGKLWTYIFFALIPLVGEILLIVWLAGKTKVEDGVAV